MLHKTLDTPTAVGARESWEALIEIAPYLGDDWVLIGGLMTTIYAADNIRAMTRETTDADIVINLRLPEAQSRKVHEILTAKGFAQLLSANTGVGHRYLRNKAIIDVLAPDNVGERNPLKLGAGTTLAARGSTRALERAQTVMVTFGGRTAPIRLPSPVGALVVKGYALYHHAPGGKRSPERHRHDLVTLLECCSLSNEEYPLTKSERKILKLVASDEHIPLHHRQQVDSFLRNESKASRTLHAEPSLKLSVDLPLR